MTNKQYPTRMHEVLGVELGERFQIKGQKPWYDQNFFVDENGDVRRDGWSLPFDGAAVYLINHPERITRRPRLTEEQVRKLKALYDFGMRWMFFTYSTAHNPCLYATTNKPFYTEPDWDGQGGWSWNGERLRIKGSPLNDLERVLADAQLDIVQTLRDAGVEVDDA